MRHRDDASKASCMFLACPKISIIFILFVILILYSLRNIMYCLLCTNLQCCYEAWLRRTLVLIYLYSAHFSQPHYCIRPYALIISNHNYCLPPVVFCKRRFRCVPGLQNIPAGAVYALKTKPHAPTKYD